VVYVVSRGDPNERVLRIKTLIFPTCIAVGISCFSIFNQLSLPILGQSLTLAVADIVIALLLLYALWDNPFTIRSPVVYATLCLAGVTLLSGTANAWTDPTFDLGDFSIDYVRIVGLVVMVSLLPSLARKLGHDRLAQGTLWAVRLHVFLVLADTMFGSPLTFESGGVALLSQGAAGFSSRPLGLFGEPSFFAIYVGLSLAYILQVERNTAARYIRVSDIVLIGLALVGSTSISSFLVLVAFLLYLVTRSGLRDRAKISVGVAVFALSLSLFVRTSDTVQRENWENLVRRVWAIQPLQFVDGSSRQRLIGSSLMTMRVLEDAPLLGRGVGGKNLNRLYDRYEEGFMPFSLTTIPAQVIAAIGIIGLLPFVFVCGWMLAARETRLIGLSFVAVAFMWGGAFEQILWWYVCLGVSLKGGYRGMAGNYLQARGQTSIPA
jgi:hypothetical protein